MWALVCGVFCCCWCFVFFFLSWLTLTESKDSSYDLTCSSRQLKELQYCTHANAKQFIATITASVAAEI